MMQCPFMDAMTLVDRSSEDICISAIFTETTVSHVYWKLRKKPRDGLTKSIVHP